MAIRMGIDDDAANANWLHRKKKKTKEARENFDNFKPQDGDQLQKPRVLPVEDGGGAPRPTGNLKVRGYGANKKERI